MNEMCKSCANGPPEEGPFCGECNPDDPQKSRYRSLLGKMGSNYNAANVQCPFFRKIAERQKMIVCEGPMEETAQTIYFRRRSAMLEHIREYCEGSYRNCRVCKILMDEKYAEG